MKNYIVQMLKWALSKFETTPAVEAWPFPEPKPKRKPVARIAAKKATPKKAK